MLSQAFNSGIKKAPCRLHLSTPLIILQLWVTCLCWANFRVSFINGKKKKNSKHLMGCQGQWDAAWTEAHGSLSPRGGYSALAGACPALTMLLGSLELSHAELPQSCSPTQTLANLIYLFMLMLKLGSLPSLLIVTSLYASIQHLSIDCPPSASLLPRSRHTVMDKKEKMISALLELRWQQRYPVTKWEEVEKSCPEFHESFRWN